MKCILVCLPIFITTILFAEEKVWPKGYTDTPKLPHADWKVHDIDRPAPKQITPGKTNSDAPSDAIILFDGKDLSEWIGAKGKVPAWKVENGYMEVTNTGNIYSKREFGSCQLHIEWCAPDPPQSNSQHQGNSGVFLMDKYEIQVLDCFDNETYADGMAGAMYGQYPPMVNPVRKPGEWQTYDIIFTAPEFEGNKLVRKGYATVLLNGVLVQNHSEWLGPSTHKRVAKYKPHAAKGPIRLQDHNDKQPVRFRNIWVRPLD